jgi:hypothetical protein
LAGTSDESAVFERLAKGERPPDESILRALEAEFAVHSPLVRPWARRSRLLTSLLLLAIALGVTSLRQLGSASAPLVLGALGCSLALGVLFLPAAVPGANRLEHRHRQLLVLAILAMTAANVAWTTSAFAPLATLTHPDPLSRVLSCGLHVLLTGGLCLLSLLLPWRRADPFSPALLGGALGAFAGLCGLLAVDAGCASSEGFHALLGHASAVVVFGLLGAVFGRRWLAP